MIIWFCEVYNSIFSSITNQFYFPYISIKFRLYHHLAITRCSPLRTFVLLLQRIVVELFPIRNLAADCPILIIFKHSHLIIFHIYAVVYKTLRSSQQFNEFNVDYSWRASNPR
nr:MAG TPA: hypothetical protein [Caudoviricetes sp.]